MAVIEILQLGNELLWQPSALVTAVTSAETATTIADLGDTLADFRNRYGYGRGIAAPQIGVLKRVIVIRAESLRFDGALINPNIVWRSDRQVDVWDNCFSFPDLMVKLLRAAEVRVQYLTERGEEREIQASGDLSELLQHEIDHLDGVLAVDRAVAPRSLMTRHEWLRRNRT